MRSYLSAAGLGLVVCGVIILIANSELTDFGLVTLVLGTLFTLWYKIGQVEADVKRLKSDLRDLLDQRLLGSKVEKGT